MKAYQWTVIGVLIALWLAFGIAYHTESEALAQLGTRITRVSVASDGSQANGGVAFPPAISGDGQYVAFNSELDFVQFKQGRSSSPGEESRSAR